MARARTALAEHLVFKAAVGREANRYWMESGISGLIVFRSFSQDNQTRRMFLQQGPKCNNLPVGAVQRNSPFKVVAVVAVVVVVVVVVLSQFRGWCPDSLVFRAGAMFRLRKQH